MRYQTKNVNNIPSPLELYSKADTRFIPAKFQLHGKAERRALARTSDDHLYYIETRHPETLWDFADALREYGFADAIYITGGKCHSFYRTPDGKPHNIGDDTQHPYKKYQKIVPWIIFKAR